MYAQQRSDDITNGIVQHLCFMKLSKLLYEPINELSNSHNSGKFVYNIQYIHH